ncbi:MAG: NAD(P)/FAD-dependent oxidoreductase [Thiogranum sp.]|nr:NAD(P)/FAD-dependent oxidoreductase [Thiogranum sp.]
MGTVVVIGGGFAGTGVVRRLERRIPADWQVVLISAENFMTYTPLLPEVAGASLLPGHAVAPIRKMLHRARFYRAQVEAIDLEQRQVHYRNSGSHSLSYDHLVLACGKVANIGFVSGMAEHALALKTLGDALYLRNRIILRLEQAELEEDPDRRRSLTTFIVIGGGSSGVEVAGAITDLVSAVREYYPRTQSPDTKVVLLEGGDRLVPEFAPSLGEAALQSMKRHGVEVHLQALASEITATGVTTDAGDLILGANVICTIGTVPNPLLGTLDVKKQKDLVATGPDMSVPDQPRVWAIGDCAAIVNAHDGALSAPTAQFAVRQARQVADNIVRAIDGQATRPFRYRPRGQVASIGHRRAVGEVFGLRLSGFPAWLLWRAIYLAMLPTFVRKLQVFSEWNLELLFPRDTSQLHLARTASPQIEADAETPVASGQ